MRKLSLPIPETVQRDRFLAVSAVPRSGNTRTVRPAAAESTISIALHTIGSKRGPRVSPICHIIGNRWASELEFTKENTPNCL